MTEHEKLVERVARIIDPTSFGTTPADFGLHGEDAHFRFKQTLAYGGQLVARERATAAIAAVHAALQEPSEGMREAWRLDIDAWISEKIEDPFHPWRVMLDASPLKEVDG